MNKTEVKDLNSAKTASKTVMSRKNITQRIFFIPLHMLRDEYHDQTVNYQLDRANGSYGYMSQSKPNVTLPTNFVATCPTHVLLPLPLFDAVF